MLRSCSACHLHLNIFIQYDKCLKWFCDHCHDLVPDIVTQMPSLFNAGLLWLYKQCCDKPFAPKPSIIKYASLHTQTATPTLTPKPTTTVYISLHNQTVTPTLHPKPTTTIYVSLHTQTITPNTSSTPKSPHEPSAGTVIIVHYTPITLNYTPNYCQHLHLKHRLIIANHLNFPLDQTKQLGTKYYILLTLH